MLERAIYVGLRNNFWRDDDVATALDACTYGGARVLGAKDFGLNSAISRAAETGSQPDDRAGGGVIDMEPSAADGSARAIAIETRGRRQNRISPKLCALQESA